MRFLIFTCLIFSSGAFADVYRSVDAEGNPVFSDEPSPDAEKIVVPETQTISPPPPVRSQYTPPEQPKGYKDLTIASPVNDETIRDNEGNINISVVIEPNLLSGDKLFLYMDGQVVRSGGSTSFSFSNIDRGTHQLRAVIKDSAGRIRKSSQSVSFHMLRHFAKPGS